MAHSAVGANSGTQQQGASPPSGILTLDATCSGYSGSWPLPSGSYTAYYLLAGGYICAGPVDFNVAS